ncbi:winged helix-turn-helix transcriptional regulator [Bacillus horti]|uniref:DNA-binding HxlR family transcriptional regulator n=2 Tax=Caldalkalibacillus horti TaxID=77523 RepID=A0ABT9VYT8_9BACI|nr:helix-turn-helix domain-containing protein [Bacillus horti]MDQ0166163.1 DNA-binding HxlR family transcriptional regulator [Bacillus horti]
MRIMKREENKSSCPINYTMEIFGDSWSLLIVRDIITDGAKTFGEFLASEERIGSSVLAERLVHLEKKGIINKKPSATDGRKFIYSLTEKGLDLIPIMYDVIIWGSQYSPHPDEGEAWFKDMEYDREEVIRAWREAVQAGSSFSNGPDSVVNKLGLQGD